MARLVQRATASPDYIPGTDYVSLITQINRLPDDQVQAIGGEAGPRGTAAKAVIRARMGLDGRVSDAAMAIPSSFPSSSVLRQIQGAPADGTLPPLSEAAAPPVDPGIPTNTLELAPSRPTVVGAAPPPSRATDAPPPPQPVTPQPITPTENMGLPQAAAAAPDEEGNRDGSLAMLQAGLAILASNNRSGLGAIGEGGLVGVQAYQNAKQGRRKDARDEKLLARQEQRDAQQMDMALQKMELEKQLAEQRMALSREEMDITRSRYDPSNPLNAAQIARDKAAAAASYASAARAKSGSGDGQDGVFFGKSGPGLAVAHLVNTGQLSPEEGARFLAQKAVTGPNGEFGVLRPGAGLEQVRRGDFSNQEKDAIIASDKSAETGGAAVNALQQALSLNEKALSGPTASLRAMADRVLPGDYGGAATTEYENLISNQALGQMKDIFGAAPTEGERKVLLDLQASVDKTPKEREAILKRGIEATQKRAEREAARAQSIREGSYFREGLPSSASDPKQLSNDDLLKMLGAK